MNIQRPDLQLFDQLLITHVLPTYSHMTRGKLTYLFAHIHAMQQCHIITEQQIQYNFTQFCLHLQHILNDTHISRSKSHDRHQFPTNHQMALTQELITLYESHS